MLTGKHHFGNNNEMQMLLEKEGIKVADDKVVEFKKLFWNPLIEIKIKQLAQKFLNQKFKYE